MKCYTQKPVVNMHRSPNKSSEVVSQTLYGEPLVILDSSKESWTEIQTRDGYRGFIDSANYTFRAQAFLEGQKIASVKTVAAHLYRENDLTTSAPLMTLPTGTKLEVVFESHEQNRRWIQVRLVDDSVCWIQRGDVAIDPQPITKEEMIHFAHQFIGLPYTWGGTSSFGFDCSGFMQFLFRQMGIELPRDTGDQVNAVGMKPITHLQPCDLIFFAKENGKVVHVGLALDDARFIHAGAALNNNPTVHIAHVSDPHLKELYPIILPRRYTP